MKKIISFSLFGDDPKYYAGAEKNIILNKELLPDWETVIYYLPEKIKIYGTFAEGEIPPCLLAPYSSWIIDLLYS